ncbi:unnamed protein product, partial [Phaeothamnion confervicola]
NLFSGIITSYQEGCPAKDFTDGDLAAELCHLGLLRFMGADAIFSVKAMDRAANISILKWLQAHREEGCSGAAVLNAAKNGRVEEVVWLLENRREGSAWAALDAAAAAGHVSVLAAILDLLPPDPADLAGLSCSRRIDAAARNGHVAVIRYLRARRGALETCTAAAVDSAAANGHLDVLELLHQYSWPAAPTTTAVAAAGPAAAAAGPAA